MEVRHFLTGLVASVALVAAVTGAIELLKAHVPVLSLGALYAFAVLPVAIAWGLFPPPARGCRRSSNSA